MKRILVLISFLLFGLGIKAQSLADFDKTPMKRWSWIADAEYCMGDIDAANLTGLFGVNFAGGHLFYGGGFAGSYVYRKEESYSWISKRWQNNQLVQRQEKDINASELSMGLFGITMDFRYQMLVGKLISPFLEFRMTKAFNNGNNQYCSHKFGLCYNNKKGNCISLSVGYSSSSYVTGINKESSVSDDIIDGGGQFAVNVGFKF